MYVKIEVERKRADGLISRLTILREEFMQSGFTRTYKAMDKAVKEVGWEFADIIEGKHLVTKLKR